MALSTRGRLPLWPYGVLHRLGEDVSRDKPSRGTVAMTYNIKPGPKPKKEDGTDDRRRHVDPPNMPKHPTLPVHKPK